IRNEFSLRVAAIRNGVLRSPLSHRINGMSTRGEAHQHRSTLPTVPVEGLRDWIIVQLALGFPPSHAQVREFASRL
ncbi:hypothetical protein DER44DRAFT_634209, partial [Fusarium oxysporum]